MGIPRFEPLTGTVDGANKVFTASSAYSPGSTAVFTNGVLQRADLDDGWSESNPATGEITYTEAPHTGDIPQICYIDTTPDSPEVNIENITGQLDPEPGLTAALGASALSGSLGSDAALTGTLAADAVLSGQLEPDGEITGQVKDC